MRHLEEEPHLDFQQTGEEVCSGQNRGMDRVRPHQKAPYSSLSEKVVSLSKKRVGLSFRRFPALKRWCGSHSRPPFTILHLHLCRLSLN